MLHIKPNRLLSKEGKLESGVMIGNLFQVYDILTSSIRGLVVLGLNLGHKAGR